MALLRVVRIVAFAVTATMALAACGDGTDEGGDPLDGSTDSDPGDGLCSDPGSDSCSTPDVTAVEGGLFDVSSALGSADQPAEFGPLWVDLDGDGWLDLIFMNHGSNPSVYMNSEGTGAFVDRVAQSGIRTEDWVYEQQADRHGASCADYDNDGDLDLLVSHGAKRGETLGVKYDELLTNQGDGTFTEVPPESAPANRGGRGRSATWADYDGDGWLDVFVTNFQSPDVLYRNNGDGTFSDVTAASRLDVSGSVATWAHLDADDFPDLVVSWPLTLLRNVGGESFEDVTQEMGLGPIQGYSVAFADADGDGDDDLFAGSSEPEGRLYLREPDGFVSGPILPANGRGAGAAWGDLDNDGDLDLVRVGGGGVRLYDNDGTGTFQPEDLVEFPNPFDPSTPAVQGGGAALADFDGDGSIDLAFDDPTGQRLFRSSEGANSWLSIEFSQANGNPSGFGARVWVDIDSGAASGQTLYREHWGSDGAYRSSGCGPLHIGLGDATTVDLRVRWPSGVESTLDDVAVDQTIEVVEPRS